MNSNKLFIFAPIATFVIGVTFNILFYLNTDATADAIFQDTVYYSGVEQEFSVKNLQEFIARKKQELIEFQDRKTTCGIMGIPEGSGRKIPIPFVPILQGIWYEPNGECFAIINGDIVQENEFLRDYSRQVIRITRNGVVIRHSGKNFILKLEKDEVSITPVSQDEVSDTPVSQDEISCIPESRKKP